MQKKSEVIWYRLSIDERSHQVTTTKWEQKMTGKWWHIKY